MLRIMFLSAIVVFGLLTVIVVSGFAYRAYCQSKNADMLKINSSDGIAEGMFVRIGGIEQWIQIRGENRKNPVLLVLHGGPGFSYVPFTPSFQVWEKDLTVVQWDQRGSGRTFGKNGKAGSEPLTIDRMTDDGLEIAEFLRKHLKKNKIILFAHSWGTVLGIPMISKRPEIFSAYVGSGQIVNMPQNEIQSYNLIKDVVKGSGDEKSLKAITAIGPPPYKDIKTWMIKGRMAVMFAPPSASGRELPNVFGAALATPGYSLKDGYDVFSAFDFSSSTLYDEMMAYDARKYGLKLKVPFFIIQGEDDLQAPASLAKEYFSAVEAPKKAYVPLKGEGHTAVLVLGDRFLGELLTRVKPLVE
jgi:pimeloyl-ACP methyl ester carboxylesterase